MHKRRVVVTGLGCITPLGNSIESFWSGLLEGKSGASEITHFDASNMPVKFSCPIKDFNTDKYFDSKEMRKYDLFMQYGLAAGIDAINDSGLENSAINKESVGVAIGSGIGGLPNIENTHSTYTKSGARRISPFFVPASIINMISGNLSIKYGYKGPNISIVTACTTGTHNIGESFRHIQHSYADVMICGGAEMASSPLGVGGFASARALSTRNDDPTKASRPWDIDRDGFVLGDGAGVIVLEELEHAKKRNAKIYCEIKGYGMSGDAYHITAPSSDGDGGFRAMNAALYESKLNPNDIDYINAHGTSTPLGDMIELKAIKRLFEANLNNLCISSTKSMTGHLLGAAGAVEAIFSILAMKNQVVPPTINLKNPDDDTAEFDLVPNESKKKNIKNILSNSFGFGGTNASLIFGDLD